MQVLACQLHFLANKMLKLLSTIILASKFHKNSGACFTVHSLHIYTIVYIFFSVIDEKYFSNIILCHCTSYNTNLVSVLWGSVVER